MKEYIDREALLQDIKETVVYTARPDRENLIGRGVRLVLNRIDAAPAADVAPVVHGRWLSPKTPKGRVGILCSECMKSADWGYNYCPNCGAKMDGGKTK